MKKRYKYAIFLVMILCMVSLAKTNVCAATNGWKNGYYYINGKKQTSRFIHSGKNTYYLNKTGKKVTGWKKISGRYYFFNEKGIIYNSKRKKGAQLSKLSTDVLTMGVDASQWQGSVDWEQVKKAGVRFVMLRVGYGKGRYGSRKCTLDSRFREYVDQITQVGIPIGIYFYSYATSLEQAAEEAEFVIEQLKDVPVSFPVAYDIEDSYIIKHTSKKLRTQMAKTFMDTVAAAGYYPMYYCNQNWYLNYLNAEELKDYDFWYARYTYVEPSKIDFPYTIWQATSTQKVAGVTENTVDLNFLYKDYLSIIDTRTDALKYGWHIEDGKRKYYYRGKAITSGWRVIVGNMYYFSNKAVVTGWKTIDDERYYFDSEGRMQTGLTKAEGQYYLFGNDGVLQMTTEQKGLWIDENGVCHIKKGWYTDEKGKYFYRDKNGKIAKKQWITTKGKKYYVGGNGRRAIGFLTIKKKCYYFDKDGVMVTGWLTYGGHKYYFKKDGQMVKGKKIYIKGKKYSFDKSGKLKR